MEENREKLRCIRCINCNKLLFKIPAYTITNVEQKCPRCGLVHTYKLEAQSK